MRKFLILALLLTSAVSAQCEPVFVTVKSTKLRAQPKHWAQGLATLSFGDKLETISSTSGWLEVKSSEGHSGFVHQSAISNKRVVLQNSTLPADASADASDIVLAGKGFNKEIESSLAAEQQALNYQAVDQMEKITVSPEEMHSFIVAGKLNDGTDDANDSN